MATIVDFYYDPTATGTGDGSSRENAFTDFSAAFSAIMSAYPDITAATGTDNIIQFNCYGSATITGIYLDNIVTSAENCFRIIGHEGFVWNGTATTRVMSTYEEYYELYNAKCVCENTLSYGGWFAGANSVLCYGCIFDVVDSAGNSALYNCIHMGSDPAEDNNNVFFVQDVINPFCTNCAAPGTSYSNGIDCLNIPYTTATFVNVTPGSEDFHLVADSLLIGVGVAIPGYTEDAEGKPWNDPPSIGIYEYTAGDSTTIVRRRR